MIGTITVKKDQLISGYFSIGTGKEVILIMGSCRSLPYLNYLIKWNRENNNRFTINFIDPFNWNWDRNDERVDYEAALKEQESNELLLEMLSSVDIFIHEYYANAGMFNVFKEGEKNIYQFGIKPKIDVTLPNFNDVFILTRDIVSFHPEIKKMAVQDYNVTGKLSDHTLNEIEKVRQHNLNKFCDICSKTDFHRFSDLFMCEYKKVRFFHTFNHVAKRFTLTLFSLLSSGFLNIDLSEKFWTEISEEDMYANNYTYLSEYDIGYEWNEEVKPLKESL